MKRICLKVVKNRKVLLLAFTIVLVLVAGQFGSRALRADPGSDTVSLSTSSASTSGMVLKVVVSLGFLIAILYAGLYAMKHFSSKVGTNKLKQGAISVLHKQHIAPKKAIYILKVANRTMVVGVTDSQISHLADLSDGDLEGVKRSESDERSFKRTLLGALGIVDRG